MQLGTRVVITQYKTGRSAFVGKRGCVAKSPPRTHPDWLAVDIDDHDPNPVFFRRVEVQLDEEGE